ncbi:hypothetical protein B5808_07610 [Cnuibacter physcomitrellae]|uniref:Uncharacterized protein n=1 Tax=Cnuibacter physcomitrellae TaxID=1619308 RepID=A0A1X9LIR2_9MICO|nr:hypothetical protein B5808_07610 [Cnuibacter physcomitrellae]
MHHLDRGELDGELSRPLRVEHGHALAARGSTSGDRESRMVEPRVRRIGLHDGRAAQGDVAYEPRPQEGPGDGRRREEEDVLPRTHGERAVRGGGEESGAQDRGGEHASSEADRAASHPADGRSVD